MTFEFSSSSIIIAAPWLERINRDGILLFYRDLIKPLSIITGKALEGTQPISIIPIEIQNSTENINYFDGSLGEVTNPSETRGMDIIIEDLQCDLSKSIVLDLNKTMIRSDLIKYMQLKANELFDIELIHGVILDIITR